MGPRASGWEDICVRAWPGAEHIVGAQHTLSPCLACLLQVPESQPFKSTAPSPPLGISSFNHSLARPCQGGPSCQGVQTHTGHALSSPVGAWHPILLPPPSNRNHKRSASTPHLPRQPRHGKAIEVRGGGQPTHHARRGHPSRGDMQSPPRVTSGEAIPSSATRQLCRVARWNTLDIAASVING